MNNSEFEERLERLIQRVEAWSYSELDAGAGVPAELAGELAILVKLSPDSSVRSSLSRAGDALDDGLSAEALAAELYHARDQLRPSAP